MENDLSVLSLCGTWTQHGNYVYDDGALIKFIKFDHQFGAESVCLAAL